MSLPRKQPEQIEEEVKQGVFHYAKSWGENSFVPTGLAALIFAQHARPIQWLPMLFPPALLFSSYLNVTGYKTDSAMTTGALSTSYLVLARRRKQKILQKFGARGLVRGATLSLCLVNIVGCGVAYLFGDKDEE